MLAISKGYLELQGNFANVRSSFRPFVVMLFKSFNMEETYRLMVADEPYGPKGLDKKKHEVSLGDNSVRGLFDGSTALFRSAVKGL